MPSPFTLPPIQYKFVQLYMEELKKDKPDFLSCVVKAGYKGQVNNQLYLLTKKNQNVIKEINRRCKIVETKAAKTTAQLIDDLERNNTTAFHAGKIAESTKAIELQLKVLGAFVDKVELSGAISLADALAQVEKRRQDRVREGEGKGSQAQVVEGEGD